MKNYEENASSQIVDGVLKFIAAGGFLTLTMLAPNSAQIFDKTLTRLLNRLDNRAKERELRRILYYMKHKGLVQYNTSDYEHGIVITEKGKKRVTEQNYRSLRITVPKNWDNKWRLVFFDVPIQLNTTRRSLTSKLQQLGFQQLQKSIWIHPFPCRPEIEILTEKLGARQYITYIEISHIDSEEKLRHRFKKLLSQTKSH